MKERAFHEPLSLSLLTIIVSVDRMSGQSKYNEMEVEVKM